MLTRLSIIIFIVTGVALAISSYWYDTNIIWAVGCAVIAICLHEMNATSTIEYSKKEEKV